MSRISRLLVTILVIVSFTAACSKGGNPIEPTPQPPAPIVPTGPMADMSGLSPDERQYLVSSNLEPFKRLTGTYKVTRFASGTITVYVDPGFSAGAIAAVPEAFAHWEVKTGGVIQFKTVESKTEAQIQLLYQPSEVPAAYACALSRHTAISGNVLTGGVAFFAHGDQGHPLCPAVDRYWKYHLAHELGHLLGLSTGGPQGLDHFLPEGSDIMSAPMAQEFLSSSTVSDSMYWLYHTPPGAIPQ